MSFKLDSSRLKVQKYAFPAKDRTRNCTLDVSILMRNQILLFLLLGAFQTSLAQFSSDKLEVSLGYNLHNVYAKRFNTLIDDFNNQRYPVEIRESLGNLNWLRGTAFGVNYRITDDFRLQGVLKTRRQFMEAQYTGRPEYRQYFFRQHTVELGASMLLSEEKLFSHYAGAGLMFGVLSAYTAWTPEEGFNGTKGMIDIDHSGVVGLSLSYEAHLRLHDNIRLFVRPVAQFSLNSNVRKLIDFFAPVVDGNTVSYAEGLAPKNDASNLNGLGVEGGILILLPKF
jgi:hypothetical protein